MSNSIYRVSMTAVQVSFALEAVTHLYTKEYEVMSAEQIKMVRNLLNTLAVQKTKILNGSKLPAYERETQAEKVHNNYYFNDAESRN